MQCAQSCYTKTSIRLRFHSNFSIMFAIRYINPSDDWQSASAQFDWITCMFPSKINLSFFLDFLLKVSCAICLVLPLNRISWQRRWKFQSMKKAFRFKELDFIVLRFDLWQILSSPSFFSRVVEKRNVKWKIACQNVHYNFLVRAFEGGWGEGRGSERQAEL